VSRQLTLELPEKVYEELHKAANRQQRRPQDIAAAVIAHEFCGDAQPGTLHTDRSEQEIRDARQRFRRHFGAINLGRPIASDNEQIDADLARAYAGSNEGV
jgi:hypothetical protein